MLATGERLIAKRRYDSRNRNRNYGPRVNDRIRVSEVRVIDNEGTMLGVMSTDDARDLAGQKGLDLVEVNPKARPPVCKIVDYGRMKYEEKKKAAEAKKRQVQVTLKEITLRPKTDTHDLAFKVKHVRRFLEEGNKVKLTVRFRGREITHPDTARRQIEAIIAEVEDLAIIENSGRMEGRTMTALLAPKSR